MRILVLTNFYPPHSRGGMGLTCKSVVQSLARREHHISVLTSYHGYSSPVRQGKVARLLHLEMDLVPVRNAVSFFTTRARRETENRKTLRRFIDKFQPDIVFVWGMWNLHRTLARDAEDMMGDRVLYRFGDYWPSLPSQWVHYWQGVSTNLLLRLLKDALRPVAVQRLAREAPVTLRYPNSYCISCAVKDYLLQSGVPVEHAQVIHNGIDVEPYRQAAARVKPQDRDPRALVFVGRLIHDKGAQVAIEALARLVNGANPGWRLTIIGSGSEAYVHELEDLAGKLGVSGSVFFLGQIPSTSIPAILAKHSALIVPSLWEEPFGRVLIEGMAAGCVVVGSAIGAIPEIIECGQTGLLFAPGDADALARSLRSLVANPILAKHLAMSGQARAIERYSTERMVDGVAQLLARVVEVQLPALECVATHQTEEPSNGET